MKAQDIKVGDTLQLKPARKQAYGKDSPLVIVTGLTWKQGYKTPWIHSGTESYRPSDFSG